MTDRELFQIILDHLVTPARDPVERGVWQDIIVSAINDRERTYDLFRGDVSVDQAIPYIVGTCGHGTDRRDVTTVVAVRSGDAIVITRRKPND